MHVRDIVKQVYVFAILHEEKVDNPAADVGTASIATFIPKDRALSPLEIRLMSRQIESVAHVSDHPLGAAHDPADAGAQERADRGHLGLG